jgi:hypothetical protein
MRQIINGARDLPLRHISIRVPWNDNDWTGKICKNPIENTSCMILKRNIEVVFREVKFKIKYE